MRGAFCRYHCVGKVRQPLYQRVEEAGSFKFLHPRRYPNTLSPTVLFGLTATNASAPISCPSPQAVHLHFTRPRPKRPATSEVSTGDVDLLHELRGVYIGVILGLMENKMETTIMENQMEKKMENEMETGLRAGPKS